MTHIKEVLQRTPPPILYHYTTQQGLLGIIGNKDIWATHTQYLNDIREYRHALDLVTEELSTRSLAATDDATIKYLTAMKKLISLNLESINVCVCSFSENGDVLSQWRAYGGAASGFAIGFAGSALREISGEYGWLVPVLYDEDQQRQLVRTLMDDVFEEIREEDSHPEAHRSFTDDLVTAATGNLLPYLHRYAPILKHKSFAEE